MTISKGQILSVRAPLEVKHDPTGKILTVTGFSEQDPLGVGGGMFPDFPTAYFESGGWILVQDLCRHFSLVSSKGA